MSERAIIMSGDNPKLILDGRKTQTRRIIKGTFKQYEEGWSLEGDHPQSSKEDCCPYGVAGDRLWVRESFWQDLYIQEAIDLDGDLQNGRGPTLKPRIYYRADGACPRGDQVVRSRPSIHMPRWASRITLEITKVRVERLQDISDIDACREGCGSMTGNLPTSVFGALDAKAKFQALWDSLHGKGAWDKNPWVWVLEFERI